jgi:hypothetical protein
LREVEPRFVVGRQIGALAVIAPWGSTRHFSPASTSWALCSIEHERSEKGDSVYQIVTGTAPLFRPEAMGEAEITAAGGEAGRLLLAGQGVPEPFHHGSPGVKI